MLLKLFRFIVHFLSGLMPKALTKDMLTCKEVAFILANSDDISGPEYKKLRMHMFLCEACGNYYAQIQKISGAAKTLPKIDFTEDQLDRIERQRQKLSQFYNK